MAFDEVQFPSDISFGSRGGPMFRTTVLELASGHEERNKNWSVARKRFNVAYGIKDREQMDTLLAFFYARAGRFRGFRYKDWADFEVGETALGVGDSDETDFQIFKQYTSGSVTYTRNLKKIVSGTLVGVTVADVAQTEGPDYTVDYDTGIITFNDPPYLGEVVEIDAAEFDVPARFDTDEIEAEFEFWETQSIPNIPIIEIRV